MRKYVFSLIAACVLLSPSLALAGTVKEYSADMVDVKTNRVHQKMYVTEQKIRFDSFDERGELEGIAILRLDQGLMYALQQDKTYITVPMDKNITVQRMEDISAAMGIKPDIQREKQGTETVNGYQAEKFKTTVTINAGSQKIVNTYYEWNASEFAMPIRLYDTKEDETTEMHNIKIGAPAASVFEIPAGYTRNTQMEEMMKQMGGKQ